MARSEGVVALVRRLLAGQALRGGIVRLPRTVPVSVCFRGGLMPADPAADGDRRPVRIAGRYDVVKLIATGGMGTVYKALDTEGGRLVALKVLTPDWAERPNLLKRFRQEALSAAKLQHENIIAIYDFGEDEENQIHYLALEFVDGVDLQRYLDDKGPLPPEESLPLIIQAVRALDHAHQQGIVHRDIKPSN